MLVNSRDAVASAFLAVAAASGPASALTLLDTEASSGTTCCWTGTGVQVYGQTFKAPAGTDRLAAFSFFLDDEGAEIPFEVGVHAWDATAATVTGGALYFADGRSTDGIAGIREVATTTGPGVAVTAGEDYIAWIRNESGTSLPSVEFRSAGNVYDNGLFAFLPVTETDVTATWDDTFGRDLDFTATFRTAVPVPPAAGLLLAALGAFAFVQRRRADAVG